MIRNEYVHNKKFCDYVGRLTWEKSNEEWGINGHSIKEVPRELYGFFCKLHEYEKTGLEPDEVMKLKEKSEPEPPIWGDGCDKEGNIIYDMYDCPGCGQSYESDDKYGHCPKCGQALDWRDLEDL